MTRSHADRTILATHLDSERVYRCDCGEALRISGDAPDRVYFKPGNTLLDDPVMNRICPTCGGHLPGKNGRALAVGPTTSSDTSSAVEHPDPGGPGYERNAL